MSEDASEAVSPLITCGPDGQYRCNEEALAWIASIPGPVGAIAAAGKYRTGKSLLLNCLCETAPGEGFRVGSTVQACTKGLWVHRTALRGAQCSVVCIDTEGIDALDADSTHDVKVFTLALLLSSVFIYNSVGALDEAAMQTLGLVTRVAANVRMGPDEGPGELAAHMPRFVWLLRDFSLKLVDREGEEQTADEYFEEALTCSGADKQPVRQAIRDTFPRRSLHTLPRPTSDDRALQALDRNRGKMSRKFKDAVAQLRTRLLEETPPLRSDRHVLSGGMLASMCRTFAARMNRGEVPVIRDAWTLMEGIRHRDVKDRLLRDLPGALETDPRADLAALAAFDTECPGARAVRAELASAAASARARAEAEREREEEAAREAALEEALRTVRAAPSQLAEVVATLDLSDHAVARRLASVWLPELLQASARETEAAANDAARLRRELTDASDRSALELERVHAELRAARQMRAEADPDSAPPADERTTIQAAVSSAELEAKLDDARCGAVSALEDLAEVARQRDAASAKLRETEDRLVDVEAANETLRDAAARADDFRAELEQSAAMAQERMRTRFDEELAETRSRAEAAEAESARLRAEVARATEEVRAATSKMLADRVECQRSLERAMIAQAGLQDGQERLLLANKDLLEDSRIRDERQRSTLMDVMHKKGALESVAAENAILKRNLEAAEADARAFKKAKTEHEHARQELTVVREECSHLRSSKSEIIREREEIRRMLTLTDRRLAVAQAARGCASPPSSSAAGRP